VTNILLAIVIICKLPDIVGLLLYLGRIWVLKFILKIKFRRLSLVFLFM
jgi:hypothetical protein